jgi:hypothetical protein
LPRVVLHPWLLCEFSTKRFPVEITSRAFRACLGRRSLCAAGAWFTYVAAALDSRRKAYDGVSNLVEGLEAELALVSEWASGGENEKGYLKATRHQLMQAHPDRFNPSRMIFTFGKPTPDRPDKLAVREVHAPVIRPMVLLSHSIQHLFDYIDRYQVFVMGDVTTDQCWGSTPPRARPSN